MEDIQEPVGIGLLIVGVLVVIIGLVFIRRHETELEIEAEQALSWSIEQKAPQALGQQ